MILSHLKGEVSKPTPFLILSISGILYFAYMAFALLPDQTAGLGVAYAFMLVLALLVALLIDRVAVKKFKLLSVTFVEIGVILVLWLLVDRSFSTTELVVQTPKDHFVVIYKNSGKTIDEFEYTSIFSKRLVIQNPECIILDPTVSNIENFEVVADEWMGYSIKSDNIYIKGELCRVDIYWTGNPNADTEKFLGCLNSF